MLFPQGLPMLSNVQIRYLRGLAHPLSFILQTGEKGLTDAFLAELAIALRDHELVKVKLNDERENRIEMIDTIVKTLKCELVQSIGKTAVLYKRNADKANIILPKK